MSDEPGTVVPFGKYKGQPIEALAQDRQYVDWLTAQPWFKERHGNMYTLIVNNFQEPSETPEHNALQAKFLSASFRAAFLRCLNPDYVGDGAEISFKFEHEGFDVYLERRAERQSWEIYIECKPSVADDYPAVLRQILAAKKAPRSWGYSGGRIAYQDCDRNACLVLGRYCGSGATQAQFEAIFEASDIGVTFLDDVESKLALDEFFKSP